MIEKLDKKIFNVYPEENGDGILSFSLLTKATGRKFSPIYLNEILI